MEWLLILAVLSAAVFFGLAVGFLLGCIAAIASPARPDRIDHDAGVYIEGVRAGQQ